MSPSLFVLIPALACALFALMLIFDMRPRPRFHSRTGNRLRGLLAFCFALAAIGLIGLALSLHHYLTLEREVTVARLGFQVQGPQHFTATLETADGRRRQFTLRGDEWQLDARVISWKLPALLAGAPPVYRLERISGRYRDIRAEREAERSVHALDEDALLDLWAIKRQFPRWLPFVDAHYGSAAYLPMLDGAQFDVSLGGRGGLVARPADEATRLQLEQSGWLGGP